MMYRHDDWRSCITCYNRPGASVPFYGGFAKRSAAASAIAPGDWIDLAPYQGEGIADNYAGEATVYKRGFQDTACRCCMSSYGSPQCCARCSMTQYYSAFRKRASPTEKRGYETSFAPLSLTGAGLCDLCCSPDTFDYYCCAYSCSDRKRK